MARLTLPALRCDVFRASDAPVCAPRKAVPAEEPDPQAPALHHHRAGRGLSVRDEPQIDCVRPHAICGPRREGAGQLRDGGDGGERGLGQVGASGALTGAPIREPDNRRRGLRWTIDSNLLPSLGSPLLFGQKTPVLWGRAELSFRL